MNKFTSLLLSGSLLIGFGSINAQPTPIMTPPGAQSADVASKPINWLKSYTDAVSLSQSTSKPIAILFTGTSWCPACMRLEREVLNRPEFAQAVGQKFVFLKAEIPDYTENALMSSPYKPLIDRYGVDSFPTFVVIDSKGQQLFTIGYLQGGSQMYIQALLQKLNQLGLTR